MFIDSIHIEHFAALENRDFVFGRGVNILEGDNEAGKSTIAAFLRFMFYGFQPRSDERARYVSLKNGTAAGSLSLRTEQGAFRITRSVFPAGDVRGEDGRRAYRETVQLIDLATNTPLHRSEQPGEFLFGVNAEVFTSSAFIGQLHCGNVSGDSLRTAVENILFSQDEDISTQKAMKRLDDGRVFYLHKNKKGGKLYEMRCRYDEAQQRLKTAEETQKKLQELSRSITELDGKRTENKTRADHFRRVSALFEEYQKLVRSRDLDALREKEAAELQKAEAIKSRLFRGDYVPDSGYVKHLRELASEIRYARRDKEEAEKQLRENDLAARRSNLHEDTMQKLEAWGGPESIRASVSQHVVRRRTSTLFAICFLLLTIFSAALTGFLFLFGADYKLIFLLVTAVLAACSLFFFSGRMRHERVLRGILGAFGCEIEEELDNLFEEYSVNEAKRKLHTDNRRALTEKISRQAEALLQATTAAASELDRLQQADSAPISPKLLTVDQIETIAVQLENALDQIAHFRAEADKYRAICEQTVAAGTSPEDADRQIAQIRQQFGTLDPEAIDPAALRQEIDFAQKANEALAERILMLKTSYAEINASYEDPAVLRGMLEELDATIASDSEKLAALELAIAKLGEASETLRGKVAPALSEEAGRVLGALTGGKYDTVGLDASFAMRYQSDGLMLSSAYMSAGTRDIAYIGLRFALVNTLYRTTKPPMLFDESFAMLDDKRLEKMLFLLFSEGQNERQSFVFTCHTREREMAEQMGLCAVIHL